ncbi:MAG: adventurous gliding motility lipoprotein CglB [Cystobacterineae bacterium]|nr:adventurous gliding motility lipoprotein CglB [Cystobacterineae bacterium]
MKNASLFLVLGFALAACQTYDFEPVKPLAVTQVSEEIDMEVNPLPANIMILLDKSGSMEHTVNPGFQVREGQASALPNTNCSEHNCYDNPNYSLCTSSCSTRINELRYAMREFLEESRELSPEDPRPLGNFGLTLFPMATTEDEDECAAPQNAHTTFATSDENAALRTNIDKIQSYIFDELFNTSTRTPIYGGTPTGNSLEYLLDNVFSRREEGRKNYILLLTDGLPNCNANNAQPDENQTICPNNNQCMCTMGSVCKSRGGGDEGCGNGNGCLDTRATVEVIRQLHAQNIQTFVIGFGDETSGTTGQIDAVNELNAMARAGGLVRDCDLSQPGCTAYYPAKDREELLKALRELAGKIVEDPCFFRLSANISNEELINVYVENNLVAPGPDTYQYNALSGILEVQGNLCERLQNSNNLNPVKIRISVLQPL